jgi:hypothetical protein
VHTRSVKDIPEPCKIEIAGDYIKQSKLYSSPNIIKFIKSKRIKLTRHVARMVKIQLSLKNEGYNIKTDFKYRYVGCERVDWTGVVQGREKWLSCVNTIINC